MSLEQHPGYMVVTDTDGAVTLDTRDELFHVLTTLEGTVNIPALDWGPADAPDERTATYAVGSVDAGCTHVIGFCKLVYSSGFSLLPSGVWVSVGGTILPMVKRFESTSGVNASYISSMQALTFELSGGTVVLREETVLSDNYYAGPNYNLAALAVTYKLFAGTFT